MTTTVKKSSGGTLCLYIPVSWEMKVGMEVRIELFRAKDGPTGNPYSFRTQLRIASKYGAQKVTVPKVFHLDAGEWVTYSLLPIDS